MQESFKKILKEMLPHRGTMIVIIITGIIWSAAVAQYSVMVKRLLNAVESGSKTAFIDNVFVLLILAIIVAITRYYNGYLMSYTSEIVVQGLRQKLQKKFMHLNLTFYNNFGTGSGGLMSRILNDMIIVKDGAKLVADFFREPLLVIFLIVWLLILNWKLTLLIFTVLPITLLILKSLSRSIRKYGEESQIYLEKITSTIKETLDGIRIIQSFNLEKEIEDRFDKESKEFLKARKKISSRLELSSPATELVATIMLVGLLTYLLSEIAGGQATYGDFASYLMAVLAVGQPIRKLQESYTRFQEASVAAKRIYNIIENTDTVAEPKNPTPFPKDWDTIAYKNVNFSYGNDKILNNISFNVQRGQMVAFVGASGSGKSTIVNLLERFFDPLSGEILIGQVPIQQIPLADLRHHVALVSQDVFLFSDSIERNIQAGDFTRPLSDVQSVAKMAHANEFISKMPQGYQSRAGDRGGLLSGGEKQRISIARAFFKNAPILILDEATSALDSSSEIEVQKGLDLLAQGRTTFVIAHRLSTIIRADKIFVIKSGNIVEQGRHQELLLKSGEYAKLYALQSSM